MCLCDQHLCCTVYVEYVVHGRCGSKWFQAEDIEDVLVLRLYEAFGSHVTVDVTVNLPLKTVQLYVAFTKLLPVAWNCD